MLFSYRSIGLTLTLVLVLVSGCGGGGGGLNPKAELPRQPANFDLNILDDTYLGLTPTGEFSRSVTKNEAETVVEVNVTDAEDLRAVYFELAYDPEKYTPIEITTNDVVGVSGNILKLDYLNDLGTVHSGQVLIHCDRQSGFYGDTQIATVRFSNAPCTSMRRASTAPLSQGSRPQLTYEAVGDGHFSWYYANEGDYDQNGEVAINDLTPLGIHFNETSSGDEFPYTSALSVIDGDGNGELNISDLTPIGINYRNSVTEWRLFHSMDIDDYPLNPDDPNGATALLETTIPHANGTGDITIYRSNYSYDPVGNRIPTDIYWVRPYDEDDGTLGIASNYIMIPDVGSLEIEQINYEIGGQTQDNSMFGSVRVYFDPADGLQYLNVSVDGDWVIKNIPVVPMGAAGVTLSGTFGFELTGTPGDDVTSVGASATLTPDTQATAPTGEQPTPVKDRDVKVEPGRGGGIQPGNPQNEFGDEVVDYAAHAGDFPNQDCGENECVPTAVSNSLQWLHDQYGVPDDSDDTSIGAMKDATDWGPTGSPEGWGDTKDTYMTDNDYGITTDQYPDPDDIDHAATDAECQAALDAIRNGYDVEMNGEGHCAALVGMAKLSDGRYVMYVAHDTNQGVNGGQRIEKVIYDPSAASPVAEGGWGFNGGLINGFVVEYPTPPPDLPDIELFQVDYTLDGVPVTDSEFGMVDLTYTTGTGPQYFNMSVNGEWVIENIPILPIEESGIEQTVSMMFPLPVESGTDIQNVMVAAEISDTEASAAPAQPVPIGLLTMAVLLSTGTNAIEALLAGTAANEQGGVIDGNNWAVHAGTMPNQEAKDQGCVPTACSNSLQFLKAQNPTLMSDVPDSAINVPSAETMTGYEEGIGVRYTKDGTKWILSWPNRKAKHMSEHNIRIKTSMIPARQEYESNAAAADCDKAIQAIKDGKDVELNGANHCAALVGMAKLTNGKYVMYVAHDTKQGEAGGQKIEKVIYDPSATTPLAEGGWGFNGKRITGFTVEEPTLLLSDLIILYQTTFTLEGVETADTAWGELILDYEPIHTSPVNFLNVSYNGEWIMRDVPIRGGGEAGSTEQATMRFNLGNTEGDAIEACSIGLTISEDILGVQPDEELGYVDGNVFVMDSGEAGTTLQYTGVTTDPVWFVGMNYTDAAFHPTTAIVNQDCGNNECAPAAVSNSLKTIANLDPGNAPDIDDSIGTMRGACNTDADGSPAGAPGNAGAWWNTKKAWMEARNNYPVQTTTHTNGSNLDDIIQAIKDGKDVELRVPGHVVMVTGIVKLSNGDYVLEIQHDTNQGTNGGTVTELVRYNTATKTFSGSPWIQGKTFTDGTTNGCMFVIEHFSNLNIRQTDWTLSGILTADSTWGETNVVFTPESAITYLSLATDTMGMVVTNLPVPSFNVGTGQAEVTVRFDLGLESPMDVTGMNYGYSLTDTPIVLPLFTDEFSNVDPSAANLQSGETGTDLLYQPPFPVNWLPDTIKRSGAKTWDWIVNQDCGEAECAPAAISNSLKTVENIYGYIAGPGIEIEDMKAATGWTVLGAPVGAYDDPGAWWNLKKEFMDLDPDYHVATDPWITIEDLHMVPLMVTYSPDIELRVPGHTVMVVGAIEFNNDDMVLWVAHDTNQGTEGGTVIEPVFFDNATQTFHGPPWIEGVVYPGDGAVTSPILVMESVYPDPILYIDILSMVPDPSVPGIIPDGFNGMASVRYSDSDDEYGLVPFAYSDPTGTPGNEHIVWSNGWDGGTPTITFDTLTAGAPCMIELDFTGIVVTDPLPPTPLYNGIEVFYRQAVEEGPGDVTGSITLVDPDIPGIVETRDIGTIVVTPPSSPEQVGIHNFMNIFSPMYNFTVQPFGITVIEDRFLFTGDYS